MLRVLHAVLHVFDLDAGSCQLSDHELDLEERQARSYVSRLVRKASNSAENARATLAPEGTLAAELLRYVDGDRSFVDLSQDVARTLWDQLRTSEDVGPCDLLVADFTDTEKAPSPDAAAAADEQDAPIVEPDLAGDEADVEDRTRRFLAVVLLPRKRSFVHELDEYDGRLSSGLAMTDATLPNPTQKLSEYVVIDVETLEAELVDEGITIAGRPVRILADTLLACTPKPSTRAVVDTVVRLVGDLAQEAGRSASVAMADAKDYVTHSAQQSTRVTPSEVGEYVFADEPELLGRYEEAIKAEDLPEEVKVKPSVANRLAKSHRIRTDTGIDITFPSAYAADQHFIEFGRDEEGGIQIVIHASSIENR
jgi:hypothetical protein